MDITKIKLALDSVDETRTPILTGVSPYYRYLKNATTNMDERTDQVEGTAYQCVSASSYEKFTVKVPGAYAPVVTPEDIAMNNMIRISFDGFQGKIYWNKEKKIHDASCTAKLAKLADMKIK